MLYYLLFIYSHMTLESTVGNNDGHPKVIHNSIAYNC